MHLPRVPVAEMADVEGNWRWDLFQHLLPWEILLRMATVKGPKESFQACQGKLMTNEERAHRKFTLDPQCPICSATVDSVDHVLRLYSPALAVWSLLIKEDRLLAFLQLEFRDWLRINLMGDVDFVKDRLDWDLMFGAIL
ncbi:hypothetical protein V6N13_065799 [Hibiscus sabdariffa]